jgi:glucose/arabinose dehydrogenase
MRPSQRYFMRHVVLAALIVSGAFIGTSPVQGQKAKGFTCDPDNGGLILPPGFCAAVIADKLGTARNLVVAPNGDVFVSLRSGPRVEGQPPSEGYIVGLRDTNGDGRMDVQEKFGTRGATGIRLRNGYLYYATITSIERFKMMPGELKPAGPAEVVVGDFPSGANQRGHRDKDIAFDNAGNVYVNVGLPSNACAEPDRQKGAKGVDPCPQLEEHGGIWKFSADTPGQKFSKASRYASGMRQAVALDWYDGNLYVAMNSRDSLDTLYPEHFSVDDNVNRPLEPLLLVKPGSVFGWPYCFFDGKTNKMILAPEYGGDGTAIGRCAQYEAPIAAFPAHYAPVDLMFYSGSLLPARYRGGVFMTSHGSWNRAPHPMAGYNVMFQPFANGKPSGPNEVFADGFKGKEPLMSPADAAARPNGTAQGPDGSIYITESVNGKTWRVIYNGS